MSILKTCACPSLGLKYVTWVDIFRLAKKTMFKVAFHGGFNNVWNGVMTIPEVCNHPNHILLYLTFPQGTPDQTLHDGPHGVRLL